jgi:hypothetical protein
MDTPALMNCLESRAIWKGLAIFLVLTLLVPFLVAVGVSFGPREWLPQYVHASRFEPVLFIIAGVLAASVTSRAPILNSLVAAAIGAVISLALTVAVRASPHLDLVGIILAYVVIPIGLCFIGASFVALAKRGRNAL